VLDGLEANGLYTIQTQKAGFIAQSAVSTAFHGGDQSAVNFFITQAQPGSISGKVTLLAGGAPVSGLNVIAQSKSDPTLPVFSATSDASGNYTIKNTPVDMYMVSIPPNPPGNRTALGFGDTVPGSYGFITLNPITACPSFRQDGITRRFRPPRQRSWT